MSFIKTLTPEESPGVARANQTMQEMFGGLVPQVFTSMNLRPDLLEALLAYVKRLLIEDHALSRTTKELIAAHVSQVNSCDY